MHLQVREFFHSVIMLNNRLIKGLMNSCLFSLCHVFCLSPISPLMNGDTPFVNFFEKFEKSYIPHGPPHLSSLSGYSRCVQSSCYLSK